MAPWLPKVPLAYSLLHTVQEVCNVYPKAMLFLNPLNQRIRQFFVEFAHVVVVGCKCEIGGHLGTLPYSTSRGQRGWVCRLWCKREGDCWLESWRRVVLESKTWRAQSHRAKLFLRGIFVQGFEVKHRDSKEKVTRGWRYRMGEKSDVCDIGR